MDDDDDDDDDKDDYEDDVNEDNAVIDIEHIQRIHNFDY